MIEDENKQSIENAFFILGAARSATASTFNYLNQHDDICGSSTKEPNYFQFGFDSSVETYIKKHFQSYAGEQYTIEAAHRNMFYPFVAKNIYGLFPNAKFIVILRDPVARTFSHYWFYYARGVEKLSFEEAILHDLERIENGPLFSTERATIEYKEKHGVGEHEHYYRTYVDSSYYYDQIAIYLEEFSLDQFLFLKFEDVVGDMASALKKMQTFLGVSEHKTMVALNTTNRSRTIVGQGVIDFFSTRLPLRSYVPAVLKKQLIPVVETFENAFSKKTPVAPIKPFVRRFLNLHFKEKNAQLDTIVDFDFEGWYKP